MKAHRFGDSGSSKSMEASWKTPLVLRALPHQQEHKAYNATEPAGRALVGEANENVPQTFELNLPVIRTTLFLLEPLVPLVTMLKEVWRKCGGKGARRGLNSNIKSGRKHFRSHETCDFWPWGK